MIRLIASDLDGTLLNEESMLSEKTAECIRTAQQAGILWVAATGRSLKTASELIENSGSFTGISSAKWSRIPEE